MTDKWVIRFMRQAEATSYWLKDPRRKVGCLIVNDELQVLSGGFNGFPRGVKYDDRLDHKEIKNKIIIHAEANAIAAAARLGHPLKNSNAFISNFPCMQCAGLLVQVGVKAVYCKWDLAFNPTNETITELSNARYLLLEANIQFYEITPEFMAHGS
jgi:deoxycytidylate deaminase